MSTVEMVDVGALEDFMAATFEGIEGGQTRSAEVFTSARAHGSLSECVVTEFKDAILSLRSACDALIEKGLAVTSRAKVGDIIQLPSSADAGYVIPGDADGVVYPCSSAELDKEMRAVGAAAKKGDPYTPISVSWDESRVGAHYEVMSAGWTDDRFSVYRVVARRLDGYPAGELIHFIQDGPAPLEEPVILLGKKDISRGLKPA